MIDLTRPRTLRELKHFLWPDYKPDGSRNVMFYDKQWEIVESVEQNIETYVPAGNMLGKDYIAGFICLGTFLLHKEVRVVTTSVKADQLRVLWGEIGRFVQLSNRPLEVAKGGPLIINHFGTGIRKVVEGEVCPVSYLTGQVSLGAEGLSGHHARYTLAVGDEASGIHDLAYEAFQGWAKRMLFISNPNDSTNFFRRGVKAGDLLAA